MSAEDAARYSMRRRLLALHAEAADFFHLQLMKKPSAQIARDYLKSRGIGGEVAKSWKIGYAPDAWDAMRDFGERPGIFGRGTGRERAGEAARRGAAAAANSTTASAAG